MKHKEVRNRKQYKKGLSFHFLLPLHHPLLFFLLFRVWQLFYLLGTTIRKHWLKTIQQLGDLTFTGPGFFFSFVSAVIGCVSLFSTSIAKEGGRFVYVVFVLVWLLSTLSTSIKTHYLPLFFLIHLLASYPLIFFFSFSLIGVIFEQFLHFFFSLSFFLPCICWCCWLQGSAAGS